MKKKMMVWIFAILLCFSLVGCKAGESKSKYPYVTVKRTMWRNDNTDIDIGGEYELNDFNKETTEDGCTVTLNFDLKSKKKNKSASETTKEENDTVQKSNSQFKLDVEPILQLPELPTGCEITSLATVLNYYGYDISKTQLADEYLECGDKIIFTRDTHRENYLETLEGKNLPVEHCIYGTEGWRIIPELVDDCKEYPDCSFIDKVTFGYENWKDIFGTVDEYSIELVGLCTDICVVSNALALRMFYPSWNISVDESCCAGVTTKKHKAALEVMKSCQIEVTNSQKTK